METAFQDWVLANGGVVPVAKRLGVSVAAVRLWYFRGGWPKVETILVLIRVSKGTLTFENIIASTRPRRTRSRSAKK